MPFPKRAATTQLNGRLSGKSCHHCCRISLLQCKIWFQTWTCNSDTHTTVPCRPKEKQAKGLTQTESRPCSTSLSAGQSRSPRDLTICRYDTDDLSLKLQTVMSTANWTNTCGYPPNIPQSSTSPNYQPQFSSSLCSTPSHHYPSRQPGQKLWSYFMNTSSYPISN